MKSSKVSAAFITKFSSYLSKFKSSETIGVAHQQIKKLFSQYSYNDIALAFASKMDSCDNLSEKERKEYSKIYINFMEVYGQEVVLSHYERIIESMAKKTIGVSEVVGHLCKSLLNRIYPTQNISNYIQHLLIAFAKNVQILKIVKQIVQSFDSELTIAFESDMIAIITEKISQQRYKIESLEAILAIILAFQQKFQQQAAVQHLILKLFKNEEWNTRKLCVDIAYALLVVKNQANNIFNEYIKELKYDKIKHVRDSVSNYNSLYKQIYGQQQKNTKTSQRLGNAKSFISKSPNAPYLNKKVAQQTNHKSLDKSLKQSKNKDFFQNAKNSDIIKISENRSTLVMNSTNQFIENRSKLSKKAQKTQQQSDFQQYLLKKSPNNDKIKGQEQKEKNQVSIKSPNSPKPNKNMQLKKIPKQDFVFNAKERLQNNFIQGEFEGFKNYMIQFQTKILSRMQNIENRLTKIQQANTLLNTSNSRSRYLEQSFDQRFNVLSQLNHEERLISQQSRYRTQELNAAENIQECIIKQNWDQAYSLALANKNKKYLFELLSHQKIPEDKLIQSCLLAEIRKDLSHSLVLQWILHYIQEAKVPEDILNRLQKQIKTLPEKSNRNERQQRNNWMLKNMILNEISSKLFGQ